MRAIHKVRTQASRRYRRHLRVRRKVGGSPERPRLVVFRSSKHIYAQVVDDPRGVTLVGATDSSEGIEVERKGKTAKSFALGRLLADRASENGITKAVFDRSVYEYHGRVNDVRDGARQR